MIFKLRGMKSKKEETPEMEQYRKVTSQEAERLRDLDALEHGRESKKAEEEAMEQPSRVFSWITGAIFLINFFAISYFVLPQAVFVTEYVLNSGISFFIANFNYAYAVVVVNLALAILSAATGVVMFTKYKNAYIVAAVVGCVMILAVSSEYLSSSTGYLLIIDFLTFLSLGTLAYSRTLVFAPVEEQERRVSHDVVWPKVENYR